MGLNKRIIKIVKLKLGEEYNVFWVNGPYNNICRLVKVTPKGYNLLILNKNKMFMYPHIYPSKKEKHQDGLYFFINVNLNIQSNNRVK